MTATVPDETRSADLATLVSERLTDFLARQATALLDVSPDLTPVVRHLRSIAGGGKRLRATFCCWGWRGTGREVDDCVVDAASSLELFHLAALVHDDLMDHSSTRRGVPSAHEAFASEHRRSRLHGDADEFGTASALLLGDLCLTWSDQLLSTCTPDGAALKRARGVYDLMRTQVVAGQYLDMVEQARSATTVQASRLVMRFKSAKYTVEHPLLLGGALGDAPDDLMSAYSAYGLPVGEAFQLRDDVLGVFGDPSTTGKPAGDDLREGKKTLLVLTALERGDAAQRDLLQTSLGDRTLDEARVDHLRAVLVDTGALAAVEGRIERLTERAVAGIDHRSVPTDVRDGLGDLARSIAVRAA